MFCRQCGTELKEGAVFCSNCGKTVKGQHAEEIKAGAEAERKAKRNKKIAMIAVPAVCAVIAFVIILKVVIISDEKDSPAVAMEGDNGRETYGGFGDSVEKLRLFNSDKQALAAYKEFYHEFYEENAEEIYGWGVDCPGKIVLGPDQKLMMTIYEGRISDEEGPGINPVGTLRLYSYEEGEVVEKTEVKHMSGWDSGIYLYTVDEKLYLVGSVGRSNGVWDIEIYEFNEKNNEFEAVIQIGSSEEYWDNHWEEKDFVDAGSLGRVVIKKDCNYKKLFCMMGVNYDFGLREPMDASGYMGYMWVHSAALVDGSDFEKMLDEMANEKINNPLDLQLFYLKRIKKWDLWKEWADRTDEEDTNSEARVIDGSVPEYFCESGKSTVAVTETEDGYYGIRSNGTAILLEIKDKGITDVSKIPEEINGCKVTGIGERAFWGCDQLETAEIPDHITYIEDVIFYQCQTVELPRNIIYCRRGGEQLVVEAPDSAEAIKEAWDSWADSARQNGIDVDTEINVIMREK